MPSHPLTIHYRGHVIRERYLEDGLSRYTIDDHGMANISDALGSPAACRNEIDLCFSRQSVCAARLLAGAA